MRLSCKSSRSRVETLGIPDSVAPVSYGIFHIIGLKTRYRHFISIPEVAFREFLHRVNLSGAPNDGFLPNALKRCFRLSGVLLKLCRLILGCAIKFLSVRSF